MQVRVAGAGGVALDRNIGTPHRAAVYSDVVPVGIEAHLVVWDNQEQALEGYVVPSIYVEDRLIRLNLDKITLIVAYCDRVAGRAADVNLVGVGAVSRGRVDARVNVERIARVEARQPVADRPPRRRQRAVAAGVGAGLIDVVVISFAGPRAEDRNDDVVKARLVAVIGQQAQHVDAVRGERSGGIDGVCVVECHRARSAESVPSSRDRPGDHRQAVVTNRTVQGDAVDRHGDLIVAAGVYDRLVVEGLVVDLDGPDVRGGAVVDESDRIVIRP